MATEHSTPDADHAHATPTRQPASDADVLSAEDAFAPAPAGGEALLGDPRLAARGNEPVLVALMRQAQQSYGNRAVQRQLAGEAPVSAGDQQARAVQRWATARHAGGDLASVSVQRYPPKSFKVGSHFTDRMSDHSISKATVDDVVNNGAVYDDTAMPGATIYYKDGIAVVHDGSKLQTCYPGRLKPRWQPK